MTVRKLQDTLKDFKADAKVEVKEGKLYVLGGWPILSKGNRSGTLRVADYVDASIKL